MSRLCALVFGFALVGAPICVSLGLTGPAAAQEIRPTLDKVKETGVVQVGYRERSRPFSFVGDDGRPAGYSIDLHMIFVDGGSMLATTASGIATVKDLGGKRVGVISHSIIQVSVVPRDAVVAKLTDSDPVRVGDPVLIVGAPYGLSHSLSAGIISARWEADTVTRDFPLAEFFQTDAVINTGNSNGPMSSCQEIVSAMRNSLKLPELKTAWVAVTPGDRIPKLVKGTIDLECGSTTITFGRMEERSRSVVRGS